MQKVILLHDSARPPVAETTREMIEYPDCEVLPAVLSFLSSIRLPLVPIDAAFLPGENLHGSRKCQK
jgi:hypothetical protein